MKHIFRILGAFSFSLLPAYYFIDYCIDLRGRYTVGGELFLIVALAVAGYAIGDALYSWARRA